MDSIVTDLCTMINCKSHLDEISQEVLDFIKKNSEIPETKLYRAIWESDEGKTVLSYSENSEFLRSQYENVKIVEMEEGTRAFCLYKFLFSELTEYELEDITELLNLEKEWLVAVS